MKKTQKISCFYEISAQTQDATPQISVHTAECGSMCDASIRGEARPFLLPKDASRYRSRRGGGQSGCKAVKPPRRWYYNSPWSRTSGCGHASRHGRLHNPKDLVSPSQTPKRRACLTATFPVWSLRGAGKWRQCDNLFHANFRQIKLNRERKWKHCQKERLMRPGQRKS